MTKNKTNRGPKERVEELNKLSKLVGGAPNYITTWDIHNYDRLVQEIERIDWMTIKKNTEKRGIEATTRNIWSITDR